MPFLAVSNGQPRSTEERTRSNTTRRDCHFRAVSACLFEGGVEMSVGVTHSPEPADPAMTPLDKKFLRSLKISVE